MSGLISTINKGNSTSRIVELIISGYYVYFSEFQYLAYFS
jgi:hypothetical protein